ncbi:hypothetical protein [Rhodococcus sp. NPDC060176]
MMRQQWGLQAAALTLVVKPDTAFATLQSQAAKGFASDADAVTRWKAFSK